MSARSHLPCLDGLRAVAVLLVIWTHVPADVFGPTVELWKRTLQAGYLGVDIFFVLSGFLITRILLADRERGRPLRHFLARRLLRIFPIYYLTLAVIAVTSGGPGLIPCALYLSNVYFPLFPVGSPLRHTWSLSVEEHFYLIWPVCVYVLSRRASRNVLWFGFLPAAIGGAILVVAARDLAPLDALITRAIDSGAARVWSPPDLIYQFTLFRAGSLAIGALMAFGERGLRRRPGLGLAAALLGLLLGETLLLFGYRKLGLHWFPVTRLVANGILSGSAVYAAICLGDLGRAPAKLLANAPLRYVGRISYGLYLYHYPIFHALGIGEGDAPTDVAQLGLALGLTFATASVSFAVIERPLLRYADRFREAPAAAA